MRSLSNALSRPLKNRRQERIARQDLLRHCLDKWQQCGELAKSISERELDLIDATKGRTWNTFTATSIEETKIELHRYGELLRTAWQFLQTPERTERLVHVSRKVAGDTHWLRPENEIWRNLADDLLTWPGFGEDFDDEPDPDKRREKAVRAVGFFENLTSVSVLVYGNFHLERSDQIWTWPTDSRHSRLPVWLSALHLQEARVLPVVGNEVNEIISVENETSFHDLIDAGPMPETVLVYTAGQANRAVIALLRKIAEAFPRASFHHQGDLDLAGVRILHSLRKRTGIDICPMNMDADTHRKYMQTGRPTLARETAQTFNEIERGLLPCQDLLKCLVESRIKIEQEAITGDYS